MVDVEFTTTGNSLIDLLCYYGLFELALRVEPSCRVEFDLHSPIVMRIRTRYPSQIFEQKLAEETQSLKEEICRKIPYKLDVDFFRSLAERCERSLSLARLNVRKGAGKRGEGALLPMRVFPTYGKGLRTYDSPMQGVVTRATPELVLLYLLGLTLYSLNWEFQAGRERRMRFFTIAPTARVDGVFLCGIRRAFVRVYGTTEARRYLYSLREVDVPLKVVPLALLTMLDYGLASVFSSGINSMIFGTEGTPPRIACRTYGEFNSTALVSFISKLGPSSYAFRELVYSLVRCLSLNELRSSVLTILIDIARSIAEGNVDLLIGALHKVHGLKDQTADRRKLNALLGGSLNLLDDKGMADFIKRSLTAFADAR